MYFIGILFIWHIKCKSVYPVYLVYKVYRAYKIHRQTKTKWGHIKDQEWGKAMGKGKEVGAMTMVITKSSQKGLKDGWTRATFILRKDYLEKIKASAYWQRKKVKEVIDEALGAFLKGKKIRPLRSNK